MLSQTAQYALRAVLHIAEHPDRGPANVQEIAKALGVPRNYLSKTLHQLARAGVLTSSFGPGGGFRLALPAHRLTLEQVISPFDTAGERHCLLGQARCSDARPCMAHDHWKATAERIQQFFANTTVAALLAGDAAVLPTSTAPPTPSSRRGIHA